MLQTVFIPSRFRGPPASANGGYACGVLGAHLAGTAEVTLRQPPPLDLALELEVTPAGVQLRRGEVLIAEGAPSTAELQAPAPVSLAEATEAATRYPGFHEHPYPGCFVCGPERAEGDGLRIFPGRVEGRDLAAAPWRADPSLCDEAGRARPEILWAVLDCPSWFGFAALHPHEGKMLLGRLTARIDERPRAGEDHVVAGWLVGAQGRKVHCGSALFAADGRLLAVALAVWLRLA